MILPFWFLLSPGIYLRVHGEEVSQVPLVRP